MAPEDASHQGDGRISSAIQHILPIGRIPWAAQNGRGVLRDSGTNPTTPYSAHQNHRQDQAEGGKKTYQG